MKQKRPIRYLFFGTILATIYVPIIIYFPNSFLNTVIENKTVFGQGNGTISTEDSQSSIKWKSMMQI